MKTELATTKDLETVVSSIYSRLTKVDFPRRYSVRAVNAPSLAERTLLAERIAWLDNQLKPCEKSRIIKKISILTHAFVQAKPMSDESLKTTLEMYAFALSAHSDAVITEACSQFVKGERGDGKFMPMPAELNKACQEIASRYLAEKMKIADILNAEIEEEQEATPEFISKIDKILFDLKTFIAAGVDEIDLEAKKPERKLRAEERLKEETERNRKAYGIADGCILSPQLRNKLNGY